MWEEFASMNGGREHAAGVIFNNKLHVFGGRNFNSSYLQTTETINVDGEVKDGPDLPIGVRCHAMTAINDTVSLLSGGITNASSAIVTVYGQKSATAKTWFYNHYTEAFTSGPDLLEGRSYHGSATNVDKVTNAKIAVVTGGYGNGDVLGLDSTELLINGQWKSGTIQCRNQTYFDFL